MLPEVPPDQSTISRTRRVIDLETHEAVFTWMLQRLADASLVKGKTVDGDAESHRQFKETVPTKGYRFVADVTSLDDTSASTELAAAVTRVERDDNKRQPDGRGAARSSQPLPC